MFAALKLLPTVHDLLRVVALSLAGLHSPSTSPGAVPPLLPLPPAAVHSVGLVLGVGAVPKPTPLKHHPAALLFTQNTTPGHRQRTTATIRTCPEIITTM